MGIIHPIQNTSYRIKENKVMNEQNKTHNIAFILIIVAMTLIVTVSMWM